MERDYYEPRDLQETHGNMLEIKKMELAGIKEELQKAKDDATQSWLDSRPLIDELEKLQSCLAATSNRITISTNVMLELESKLEAATVSIRAKKKEELKVRTMIDETNQALDQAHQEMEQLKLEKDEERRVRSELKQILRQRKQSLHALALKLRAVRLESEAFGASAAEALHYVNNSELDNTTVQLTQLEYCALITRAKEEASLADWRVSVSMEKKLAVEASRDLALRRLKELYSNNKSRNEKMKDKITGDIESRRDAEEEEEEEEEEEGGGGGGGEETRIPVETRVNSRQTAIPKAQAKLKANSTNPQEQLKRSRSKGKVLTNKKKRSIFVRIRKFLVQKIARLFR